MAVTAKFAADFSDFHKGVAEADVKLAKLSTSAGVAGGSITKLSLVSSTAVGPVNTLRGSLQQFDGALAAAGLHLGPEIRALGELGDVAGKSAKEVGLLGTAGLAFGAAMGGWKIGRMIAEFFGLDQKIANVTARLLGWGDVQAAIGGAKQDTINFAISRGADAMISYSAAIQFNMKWIKDRQGVAKAAADEEKGIADQRAAWLKKAIADQEAYQKKLAALQDHLFGRDLIAKAGEYARALGGVDNISKLMPAAQAELNKAFGAAYDALVKAGKGASATALEYDKLRTATTDWAAINAQLAAMPDPFAKQLQARREAVRDTEVAILNQNAGLSASEQYWQHAGEIADTEMAKVSAAVAEVGPAAQTAAQQVEQGFSMAFASVLGNAASTADRVALLLKDAATNISRGGLAPGGLSATLAWEQQQQAMRLANNMPKFASGGPVTQDGPIYAHAGEYVLPKGAGSGGATINVGGITIHTSGATAAQDGRAAADALLARLKAAGVRV